MSTDGELCGWVDYAAHTCRQPASAFPTLDLLDRLGRTFEATAGWSWLDGGGATGFTVAHPPAGWPAPGSHEVWLTHQSEHPLLRWYAHTRSVGPMTTGRVPETVADRRCVAFAHDALGSDMAQQLSIPVLISGGSHAAFLLSRGGRDFTEDQVRLAQQLQPLLMLMGRQATLTARLESGVAGRFGLTVRESSVLVLLREGLTVPAIGHHLSCSPRTVEKHLEHLYRKMGVRDRLAAVRVADAHAAATGRVVDDRGPASGVERPYPRMVADSDRDLLVFVGRLPTPVPADGRTQRASAHATQA